MSPQGRPKDEYLSAQREVSSQISTARPIAILVAALGGQGGGVLAEWLVDAATKAGYPAQSTSIPGVAQRTGATTYYIEIFPVLSATLGARQPVLSLTPVPGCIDLLISSELLETGRMLQNGMVSADRTFLVTSTSRTLTTAEKMALGEGRFASATLLDVATSHSRQCVAFDMDADARYTGTIVSAVMFGAIAGSGMLPMDRSMFTTIVEATGIGVATSLAGFARGFERTADARAAEARSVDAQSAENQGIEARPNVPTSTPPATDAPAHDTPLAAGLAAIPEGAREFALLGYRRLVDYQDQAYADLYLARLQRVAAAEHEVDPQAGHADALTREAARFLALWMAYDDIVRVASLKCRASRFARVRREVAAGNADILRIVDYFKPGIAEIAGLLPPRWADMLTRWEQRRRAAGKAPFGLALHVRADGIGGFLALRVLAGLRGWRLRSARHAQEQMMIEQWLAAIGITTRVAWDCGYELALCGRLIKGYGATNERAKHNLLHIVDHLALSPTFAPLERTVAIRAARIAALADEGGRALDTTLVLHGAPTRPVRAQPIIWSKPAPPRVAN